MGCGVIIMISSVKKMYMKNDDNSLTGEHYFEIIKNGIVMDVPNSEENRHYQEIQEWIADGGTVIDNPPEETP
jgi:Na+/H+ antiporter NhaA